jgi:hypothetical protein
LTVVEEKIALKDIELLKRTKGGLQAINSEWVYKNLIQPKESLFPEQKITSSFFASHSF